MITNEFYTSTKSIDKWVETISIKFNNIDLIGREDKIATILAITNDDEIKKIKEASLIVYSKQHGILSFEDACNKLNIDTILPDVSKLSSKHRKQQISFYKLSVIIEAVNDGWIINWDNSSQYKYFVWYDKRSGGFSCYGTAYDSTFTYVPSALYFKSRDLAYYVGNYFIEEYKNLY